jgi:antitoxin (DNA-binding transcriptional repressor) of toxin-antitoxin stability system
VQGDGAQEETGRDTTEPGRGMHKNVVSLVDAQGNPIVAMDININIIFICGMRSITMVEFRTHSDRIVKDLKRGERMMLSYRGKPLAELVPVSVRGKMSPLEALMGMQALTAQDTDYTKKTESYVRQLREDQKAWGERSPA